MGRVRGAFDSIGCEGWQGSRQPRPVWSTSPFLAWLRLAKMPGMSEEIIVQGMGSAFAAFWVWLMVRIINRRERWAIILAVLATVGTGFLALMIMYELRRSADC